MDKEEFLNMANNPDFIPGIYNYCDRWCARCPYTPNCYLYATEKKQEAESGKHDIDSKEYWDQIGEMFRITFEMLEDIAEEQGIDLSEIDTEKIEKSEAEKRVQAQQRPAARKTRQYITEVNDWFEQSQDVFGEKGEEMAQMVQLGSPEEKIRKDLTGLKDYVEIIRWYQHQIYAKIMRALHGKLEDFEPEPEDPIQTDYNGSAKVALIGIDRSIAAWGGLLQVFPKKEDTILPILVSLEQIRTQTRKEFPDAEKFVRPGFDE